MNIVKETSKKPIKKRFCPYLKCLYKASKKEAGIKTFLTTISFFLIALNRDECTALPFIMYLSSIILDLYCIDDILSKRIGYIKTILFILNIIALGLSILALSNYLVDNGAAFIVNKNAMIFANIPINKYIFLALMLIDLSVPSALYQGINNQDLKLVK